MNTGAVRGTSSLSCSYPLTLSLSLFPLSFFSFYPAIHLISQSFFFIYFAYPRQRQPSITSANREAGSDCSNSMTVCVGCELGIRPVYLRVFVCACVCDDDAIDFPGKATNSNKTLRLASCQWIKQLRVYYIPELLCSGPFALWISCLVFFISFFVVNILWS